MVSPDKPLLPICVKLHCRLVREGNCVASSALHRGELGSIISLPQPPLDCAGGFLPLPPEYL